MNPYDGPIRVVIAADSFLLGDGLVAMLDAVPDVTIVGRARDHDELVRAVDEHLPQAVIYGLRAPAVTSMSIIETARHLRTFYGELGIVVIADGPNGFAAELLRGGSPRVAYLLDQHLPGIDAVLVSLRAILTGESVIDPTIVESMFVRAEGRPIDELTSREYDVLERMAQGLSNAAIADELNLSVKSIEKCITAIFYKLGPFESRLIDRRVSACLEYLRSQSDPFGQSSQFGRADPAYAE
jgi:DNA-binding NarL/FixJ family response regulator